MGRGCKPELPSPRGDASTGVSLSGRERSSLRLPKAAARRRDRGPGAGALDRGLGENAGMVCRA